MFGALKLQSNHIDVLQRAVYQAKLRGADQTRSCRNQSYPEHQVPADGHSYPPCSTTRPALLACPSPCRAETGMVDSCRCVLIWLTTSSCPRPLLILTTARAGDEVTLSYIDTDMPRSERQKTLKRNFSFVCSCPRYEMLHDLLSGSRSVTTGARDSC